MSASFSPALDDLHVDAAVELRRADGTLDRVVLIDVQVARLADKPFTLPVYQALARRRHRVPCDVVVIDARGISLRPSDDARLSACSDAALLGRWVGRAATASASADVFENDD